MGEGFFKYYLFQILDSEEMTRYIRVGAHSLEEAREAFRKIMESYDPGWCLVRLFVEYIPEAEEE